MPSPSEKPVVELKDVYSLGSRLCGFPLNHPNPQGLVSGTKHVLTTTIVRRHSRDLIETENTMYKILNWIQE